MTGKRRVNNLSDEEWEDHVEACIEFGSVDRYAEAAGVSARTLYRRMSDSDGMTKLYQRNAELAMVGLRHAIDKKGPLAKGYADVVEEIQLFILRCLRGEAPIEWDAEEIERLVKAAKMATDSLLTILGDPTVIQAVEVTDTSEAAQNQFVILERLAEKAMEKRLLSASSIEVEGRTVPQTA